MLNATSPYAPFSLRPVSHTTAHAKTCGFYVNFLRFPTFFVKAVHGEKRGALSAARRATPLGKGDGKAVKVT